MTRPELIKELDHLIGLTKSSTEREIREVGAVLVHIKLTVIEDRFPEFLLSISAQLYEDGLEAIERYQRKVQDKK